MARNSPENAMRFEFQLDLKPVQHVIKKEAPKKESPLRQSLVLAYQIQEVFNQGKAKSLSEVAGWLNMCHSRISQVMNLLSLAPSIQTDILLSKGGQADQVTEWNIREIAMKVDWEIQTKLWENLFRN